MKKLSWTRVGEAYSMVTRVIVEGQALQSHIPPEMSSVDSSRLDGSQHEARNDSPVPSHWRIAIVCHGDGQVL